MFSVKMFKTYIIINDIDALISFQLINEPCTCYFIHKVHQVPTILILNIDCASQSPVSTF